MVQTLTGKRMDENGVIQIHLLQEDDSIVLRFIDDGEGISDDILKKIWTPFFTTKDTGTGLGLGIVKNIIESHNGRIEIGNQEPNGVKVEIRLPV